MEIAAVLAAFDGQVRRATRPDGSGARIEADGRVVRWLSAGGRGWSGIAWSQLSDRDADQVIAAQVACFAARGEPFEWKLYDHDRPPDLGRRLAAAGLVAGEPETLMAAGAAGVAAGARPPAGVRLLPVTGESGVRLLMQVHDRAFGTPRPELARSLAEQVRSAPQTMAMVVALAGDQPVSAARIEFVPGTDFAGLWGGGTVPGWRGRGIYRALIAWRARLAAARGYRYLYVDAMPASQPILGRLGFTALARTTPYHWQPPSPVQMPSHVHDEGDRAVVDQADLHGGAEDTGLHLRAERPQG